MKILTSLQIATFQSTVWDYYSVLARKFPWRHITDPYQIFVSEIMLQQTQTVRVMGKFLPFIGRFPTFEALAKSQIRDVLHMWQGLGYNRRALMIRAIAQRIMQEFAGQLPDDPEILKTFKGIGVNSAGSICAFAFNKPVVFIETNIRAVFIYHFFSDKPNVYDREIIPLIEQTLEHHSPCEWYYALMDYGVMLKKQYKNPARRSKHYTKQSKFEGSDRQIRGNILKFLTHTHQPIDKDSLYKNVSFDKKRVMIILEHLIDEGFLKSGKHGIELA